MEIIQASAEMADEIRNILHTTIETVYPKYYPREVAEFFCRHHSREHVLDGIASGNMVVLRDNGVLVGTGCYAEDHITGVYVLPEFQNKGFGTKIMDYLESEIAIKYDAAILDASLPAVFLYEKRGYKTKGHGVYELQNGVKLVYEIMEKELK